jgi:hypothetical protein
MPWDRIDSGDLAIVSGTYKDQGCSSNAVFEGYIGDFIAMCSCNGLGDEGGPLRVFNEVNGPSGVRWEGGNM